MQKPSTSADEYLESLSRKKQETLNRFLNVFKEEGIQKQSSLINILKGGCMDKIEFLTKLAAEVPNESKSSGSKPEGGKPPFGKDDDKKSDKKSPFPPKGDKGDKKPDAKGEGNPFGNNGENDDSNGDEKPNGQESEQNGEQGVEGGEPGQGSAVPGTGAIDPKAIFDFFSQNPQPSDDDFHGFAEAQGYDVHAAEAAAYALAGKYIQFLRGGKSQGMDMSQVDENELNMGLEVEAEHSEDMTTRKKIALDHLAEIPDYYTRLAEMEAAAKGGQQQGQEGQPEEKDVAAEPDSMDQRPKGQQTVGDGNASMKS